MEGDRDLVPDTPSLLVTLDPSGPTRLDTERVKRAYIPSPPPSPPAPLLSDSPSPFPPLRPTTRPLVKRAAGKFEEEEEEKARKKFLWAVSSASVFLSPLAYPASTIVRIAFPAKGVKNILFSFSFELKTA